MMQLHAAPAGLKLTRATRDVDMVLNIDSGATTFGGVGYDLERIGYSLREPIGSELVHRFARDPDDAETVDVMVVDLLLPNLHPKVLRCRVFALPDCASALQKTVNCEVDTGRAAVVPASPTSRGRWYSTARRTRRTLATGHGTLTIRRCWRAR